MRRESPLFSIWSGSLGVWRTVWGRPGVMWWPRSGGSCADPISSVGLTPSYTAWRSSHEHTLRMAFLSFITRGVLKALPQGRGHTISERYHLSRAQGPRLVSSTCKNSLKACLRWLQTARASAAYSSRARGPSLSHRF